MSTPRGPIRTVGILGGGQLGWMLGIAARELGLECVFLDPSEHCPSDRVGDRIRAEYDDPDALDRLAARCDVVTYEFENVPAAAAAHLAQLLPVRPGPRSLEVSQDRLVEKTFIRDLGVPVPAFAAIDRPEDLDAALDTVGRPAVLKTRRGGYDGKGQVRIGPTGDPAERLAELGPNPIIAEAMVPFDLEASVLVARGIDGENVTWAPVRNEHAGGILRRSDVPAPGVSTNAAESMRRHATEIAEALEHVGVLAVEYFVVGERVLVNEIAPRVHNSGHLTIEHARTSQFENHVRAVCGLPLGSTEARFPTATMINGIGRHPDEKELPALGVRPIDAEGRGEEPVSGPGPGDARWHDYGKSPRQGRKLGHLTLVADRLDEHRVADLEAAVPGGEGLTAGSPD